MALDTAGGEQEGFLLFHLSYHLRFEPTIEGICQTLVTTDYSPLGLRTIWGYATEEQVPLRLLSRKRNGDDISLAFLQLANHFCRILTFLDTQRHTNLLGEFLTQEILETHAMVVVIIIGGRSVDSEHNHLTI